MFKFRKKQKPRMNTNGHESENDAFPFQLGVLEIEKHSNAKLCNPQVVQHLPTLHVCNPINHLHINHNTPKSDEIGNEQPNFVPFV